MLQEREPWRYLHGLPLSKGAFGATSKGRKIKKGSNGVTYGSFVRTVAQIIADNNENVKRRKNAKGVMQE